MEHSIDLSRHSRQQETAVAEPPVPTRRQEAAVNNLGVRWQLRTDSYSPSYF
jgi:hypothetical protein